MKHINHDVRNGVCLITAAAIIVSIAFAVVVYDYRAAKSNTRVYEGVVKDVYLFSTGGLAKTQITFMDGQIAYFVGQPLLDFRIGDNIRLELWNCGSNRGPLLDNYEVLD